MIKNHFDKGWLDQGPFLPSMHLYYHSKCNHLQAIPQIKHQISGPPLYNLKAFTILKKGNTQWIVRQRIHWSWEVLRFSQHPLDVPPSNHREGIMHIKFANHAKVNEMLQIINATFQREMNKCLQFLWPSLW